MEEENSMRMNAAFSRDLLIKFNKTHFPKPNQEDLVELTDSEEEDLKLNLSMNGIFGVNPDTKKKLKRSSSLLLPSLDLTLGTAVERGVNAPPPLLRASSLPAEADEDWRLRKEMQMMKRFKRMEKLKNVRGVGKENDVAADAAVAVPPSSSPQGSNGSQKSSSTSGFTRILQQFGNGMMRNGEVGNHDGLPSFHVHGDTESSVIVASPNDPRGVEEMLRSALLEMPYVSTKSNTPEGKTKGFLYRYKKGEEVKIVCVCHGQFLSPSEFVKHGGGGDVENPLQHIVVNATIM